MAKRNFADGIKVRILRYRDDPGLYAWALSVTTHGLTRERQREILLQTKRM